jgi:hypothetical protein
VLYEAESFVRYLVRISYAFGIGDLVLGRLPEKSVGTYEVAPVPMLSESPKKVFGCLGNIFGNILGVFLVLGYVIGLENVAKMLSCKATLTCILVAMGGLRGIIGGLGRLDWPVVAGLGNNGNIAAAYQEPN